MITIRSLCAFALCTAALAATAARGALPPPTPAQQEAAAAKKAKDAEQAARDKQSLGTSMDEVARRWRARAASQGWQTHPAVAVAAAPATPAGTPAAGVPAAPAPAGAPARNPVPIRSEKLGTAPPSEDVKKHPTRPQPAGIGPAVVKKNTPQIDNRK